jgi:hypothetical protein
VAQETALKATSQARVRALLGLGPWPDSDSTSSRCVTAPGPGTHHDSQPPVGWELGGPWGLGTARTLAQLHNRMGLRVAVADEGAEGMPLGGGQVPGAPLVCQGVEEQARSGWLPPEVMYS